MADRRGGRADDKRSEAAMEDQSKGVFVMSADPYLSMDMLRFTTAGSVDDGKSTLIGRLLLDTKSILKISLRRKWKTPAGSRRRLCRPGPVHRRPAAEREQRITIDVAYRFFATPRRKFIIADTPARR